MCSSDLYMKLKVIEPLKMLFKDEVRRVGKELKISDNILKRHPFPGPGLAIRILGDINEEKVKILQDADEIFITELISNNLYDKIWQAGVILLPIKSVGVMGGCCFEQSRFRICIGNGHISGWGLWRVLSCSQGS